MDDDTDKGVNLSPNKSPEVSPFMRAARHFQQLELSAAETRTQPVENGLVAAKRSQWMSFNESGEFIFV